MPYNPEEHGALCAKCILREMRWGTPVPIEDNPGSRILIVGEAPGEDEITEGRPFVGRSGQLLDVTLICAGNIRRDQVSITNALLCRPPDNNLEKVMAALRRKNKAIEKAAPMGENGKKIFTPLPSPIFCCQPRLISEIRRFKNILTVGGTALRSVVQDPDKGVKDTRGGAIVGFYDQHSKFHMPFHDAQIDLSERPDTLDKHWVRILPTLHPAFVLRMKSTMEAFQADLRRAARWFLGLGLNWQEPEIVLNPDPEYLDRFLNSERYIVCDTETDYHPDDPSTHGPLFSELLCIGFGTETKVCVVAFKGRDNGHVYYYSEDDLEKLRSVIRTWMQDPTKIKIGWNIGYFDRIVLERTFGVPLR